MTVPLSDAQLAEIRARKAAATGGGRWILVAGRTVDDVTVKAITGEDEVVIGSLDFGAGPGARDDKTFVVTAGRDIAALLAEVDRLRAESEQRLGELLFWHFEFQDAMDNYRGEAQYVKKLAAESESRRQAAAANAASVEVLQRQIDEQARELDRLRTELAVAKDQIHAVETVKCWVNEDRQRFVFAEDLAFALGYTPTTPAAPTA